MADMSAEARNSVDQQADMFRLAKRDYGLSRATLHIKTGIPKTTLKGWETGTTMPLWAAGALGKAGVPDYLLSMLLDPFERHVGTNIEGEGDLDALGREAAGFTSELLEAKSDNIVTPIERGRLKHRALRVCATARAAAA